MPGTARQFEPQITRSGGAPSQYRFTARCSQCRKADTYEANKATSDEVVKGYFRDRGWLLGRDRSDDLCSACLAHPRSPEPSRRAGEAHRAIPATADKRPETRPTFWPGTWASRKHWRPRSSGPKRCSLLAPLRLTHLCSLYQLLPCPHCWSRLSLEWLQI